MKTPLPEHPALKRIAELHAQGKTQRAIAAALTIEGIPPMGRAKGWNHVRVRDALQQLEAGENDQAVHRAPTPAPPQHPPQPSLEEQRLRGQVAERDSQIAALQRENAALLPEIDARNGEIAALKKQLAAAQKQIAALQRTDRDIPQLGPKPLIGEGWRAKLLVVLLFTALAAGALYYEFGSPAQEAAAARKKGEDWDSRWNALTPEQQDTFNQWITDHNQKSKAKARGDS